MRAALVCLSLGALLAAPAAAASPGTVYGKGLSGAESITVEQLLESPDRYVGKTVRVSGLIVGVCPMRGCWIDLAGKADFKKIRFKVKDGEIVFPVDAQGKRAVVEGVLVRTELTREQALARAKHEAEERGEPFDPGAVDAPQVAYTIKGRGAVVR